MNKIVKPKIAFTKEMSRYTILVPDMNTIHFKILKHAFNRFNYDLVILYNRSRTVVDEGLKYVHNDTCYPALLVIGQMIDALKSGKYDLNHTALMIPQTGGGCRASNYIHLLRHALVEAGFEHIPVVSLNASGLEKDSGFKLTLPLIRMALACVVYGDLLMLLENQVRPYEKTSGEAETLTNKWIEALSAKILAGRGYSGHAMKKNFRDIVKSYADIEIMDVKKIKVGIVGEIYVKYAALGNNDLEAFLHSQDCEVMVPGLLDFMLYCVIDNIWDYKLYGRSAIRNVGVKLLYKYVNDIRNGYLKELRKYPRFSVPANFDHVVRLGEKVIGLGCKMGEGWLLPAEIMELLESGYENIITVQPFGCLPNHIIAKGMSRKIKALNPCANIVAIDYDPGATKVNQENRIKLMLEMARERLEGKQVVQTTQDSEAAG